MYRWSLDAVHRGFFRLTALNAHRGVDSAETKGLAKMDSKSRVWYEKLFSNVIFSVKTDIGKN